MFQSDSYHCYYVDHSFFDARQIGSIYSQLAGVCSENKDENGLILSTCQRIEVYSASEGNPLSSLDLPFQHDSGKDSVKKRLLSICCGIESQILGEKNIYYQVRNACSSPEEQGAVKDMFEEVLVEARKIRDDANFQAEMDYEDVSFNILRENASMASDEGMALLIVGSGMLARNFLKKDILESYDDLFFVTRSPRNLRKKLDQPLKKKVLRADEFLEQQAGPFQCIIATNGLEKDGYASEIRKIVTSDQCRGVFDLSAVPLFQRELTKVLYADTYSSIYFSYINKFNAKKMPEAEQIRTLIESRFS